METFIERHMRRVFNFVVGASRGGPMRLKILELISRKPRNTNEITKKLGIDYKTTEYHLRVLRQNGIVVQSGQSYGSKFSISPLFRSWNKVHKRRGKSKK